MTRRIGLTILLTVWALLIAIELTAYWATRAVLLSDLDSTLVARAASLPELAAATTPSVGPVVRDGDDRYVIRSEADQRTLQSDGPHSEPEPQLLHAAFATLADGRHVRTVTVKAIAHAPGAPNPDPVTVTYTGSAATFDRVLSHLSIILIVCGMVGGLIAAATATWVARASLRPLRETAEVVGSIDEQQLNRRISVKELPRELVPVASRLNEMLERLELAFQRRRQFLGDAAHELRTPVAALLTGLEVTLARPRDASQYRTAVESALSAAQQLRSLVSRLMEQVRSETFSHDEPDSRVDVTVLLSECADAAAELAEPLGVRIVRQFDENLTLMTQPHRLRSVVMNILSNAVEYNRRGGMVELAADQTEESITLRIRDTGLGIAPEHIPNLFQPFYRGDPSRTAGGNGHATARCDHLGLGLFLVQTHLNALHGRCVVQSELGKGSVFEIELPGRVVEEFRLSQQSHVEVL